MHRGDFRMPHWLERRTVGVSLMPRAATIPPAKTLHTLVPDVLAVPAYRRLWHSSLLYYHCYHFEILTAAWVVLVMTNSPIAVAVVGFCRAIPMLVFGLLLGAVADRIRRADVLVIVQCVGLAAATALALLFTFTSVTVWEICLGTAAIGCAWATDFSTRRALISELHERHRVVNALSLESMSMQGNKIIATLVSGVFLAVSGPRLCYWWLAAVYALNVVATLRLRRFLSTLPEEERPSGSIRFAQLIRGGWSVAVRTPVIQGVLLITVVMNLLVFPYQQMIPVIGRDLLAIGPTALGILAGADGIGAILVGVVLTRRSGVSRHGLLFACGAFGVSLLVIVLAVSRFFALSWATQIGLGICSGVFGAMQPVIILHAVEVQMRARAMGMLATAIGVGPFGVLSVGLFSTLVGPSWTITIMALIAIALMAAIIVRRRPLLRT
jgi:MFS family permease